MPSRQPVTPLQRIRLALLGRPIPTALAHHEKLGPLLGLPVFSSDALSSVAYATEAVLGVLILISEHALGLQMAISIAICVLIVVVAISYNQTIHAYPSGGGSYIVASDNLGETPGLIAAAALLIDYVLTVSVSVAAGVAAIVSAYPHLHDFLVPMSIGFIALVAWANLRGVRESGAVFAVPTYAFIFGMISLIVIGGVKAWGAHAVALPHVVALQDKVDMIGKEAALVHASNFAMWFLILRAFAAGCTALTGIEAVSNGVPAFKSPESTNASKTLGMMAALLTIMFIGTGLLVRYLPDLALFDASKTVVSQLASWAFGHGSIPFFYIQYSTAAILILAANTSFADFPRLTSLIARDGYLPRPLARQGDRLVFHNGILLLALFSCALVWYFKGQLDALLPMYAVGVFTAFTLSQLGMVVHWVRVKESGWKTKVAINGFGATLTLIVSVIILVTKFTEGAWLVAILMVILFTVFKAIKARYRAISAQLALSDTPPVMPAGNISLLLVPRVHRGILIALEYAQLTGLDCRAVHVGLNKKALPEVMHQWETFGGDVPLVVLKSPYRSLIQPVLDYIDKLQEEKPDHVVTVIVPEAIAHRWYHKVLQENVGHQLKHALGQRKNVVVTNVRYFLD